MLIIFLLTIVSLYYFVRITLFFPLARSLSIPFVYVSIKSIDLILLLSFELKRILLISSVKTLCFSLLNRCCFFNIDLF